jgi:hypothetical protein
MTRRWLEEDERAQIFTLGAVHREVGVVNDFFHRCAVVGDQSSADGRADLL